jgi:predicted nucleic-acid-binding protein
VIAFDTDVLVRVLLGDDPAQTAAAEAAFRAHAAGAGVYVARIVIAELAWVFRAGYRLEREQIHERLWSLVRTRGVFVEGVDAVLLALERYAAGGADVSDLLILLGAAEDGARALLTFDRTLADEPGARLLESE